MRFFPSPYEHVERGQRYLGSMFPWPTPFRSRSLITKETLARAVKARVQIVTCLGLRIHVARNVAMMTWNRFPLWWRRPEAKPTGFGWRMKKHWGHPRVLLFKDRGLPGGGLWRPDDGLWWFLWLWLDGLEVVRDEGAVGDVGRMALLILVNTLLLRRKLLFLNFTGEYSSKFTKF